MTIGVLLVRRISAGMAARGEIYGLSLSEETSRRWSESWNVMVRDYYNEPTNGLCGVSSRPRQGMDVICELQNLSDVGRTGAASSFPSERYLYGVLNLDTGERHAEFMLHRLRAYDRASSEYDLPCLRKAAY